MKPLEFLYTARTCIRRFQAKDRDKLVELLCDKSVTQHMTFPEEMLTEDGVSNLLRFTMDSYESEKPLLSYAITLQKVDSLIGVTGFNPLSTQEIEVFYALLPAYWGQGFASEILATLAQHTFANTDYHVIVAPITRANKASIRVVEKAGFVNEGLQEHPDYEDLVFVYKKKANNQV